MGHSGPSITAGLGDGRYPFRREAMTMTKWPKGAIRNPDELKAANEHVFGTYRSPVGIRKIQKSILVRTLGSGWFPPIKDGYGLFNNYWDAHAFLQRYLHAKRDS